jgi:hypothetical protein
MVKIQNIEKPSFDDRFCQNNCYYICSVMKVKEEILEKIRGIQSALNGTIYPLMSDLDETSNGLFFDVLEVIQRIKKEYPDQYEANGLEYHFEIITEFGWAYLQTFKPFPVQLTLDSDGILPIGLPINEMITRFYEYVINLQVDSPDLQPVQAAFDMSVITAMAEQIKQLTGLALSVEHIKNVQTSDSEKINNVHTRLNNNTSEKKKPLTKKQREDAEIEEMRQNAHNRVRLNGYKI